MLTRKQLDRHSVTKPKKAVAATSSDDGETYIMWGVNLSADTSKPSSKPLSVTTPMLNANPSKPKIVLTKPGLDSTHPSRRGDHSR